MKKKDKPIKYELPESVEHEIKWSERIAKTLFIFAFINIGFIFYWIFYGDNLQTQQGFIGFSAPLLFMFSLFTCRYFFMSKENEAKKLDTWMK